MRQVSYSTIRESQSRISPGPDVHFRGTSMFPAKPALDSTRPGWHGILYQRSRVEPEQLRSLPSYCKCLGTGLDSPMQTLRQNSPCRTFTKIKNRTSMFTPVQVISGPGPFFPILVGSLFTVAHKAVLLHEDMENMCTIRCFCKGNARFLLVHPKMA
ncbi:hypothetical protein C8R45DRAFT_450000 [Mycena sanguinolenta]|nr:hypothetical protein C8R45DRAFT_450000 [Mycena sanguinolenta]